MSQCVQDLVTFSVTKLYSHASHKYIEELQFSSFLVQKEELSLGHAGGGNMQFTSVFTLMSAVSSLTKPCLQLFKCIQAS